MLKDIDSQAILAVSDIARAKDFYANMLGLEQVSGDNDMLEFRTGSTSVSIYRSDYAGTNKANALAWGVGSQIEAIVAELAGRGIKFEHYPEMGMDFAGGIHSAGEFKAAWFKDPDGNILHVNNM